MAHLKASAARVIDVAVAPATMVLAPLAAGLARLRAKAPLSRSILDRFNVAVVRHHYYQPIVFPDDLHRDLGTEREISGLDMNEAGQLALIGQFCWREELLSIPREKPAEDAFGYLNGFFEAGDAEILYGMIRHFKPRRIVEVGSGQSTLMARLAISANQRETTSYFCEHTCIEPFEQPWLERLGVRVLRERVELCPTGIFAALEANDILFIDSSHIIRPQGDVVHEILYLFGMLQPGALIHVHDIFTPRDYPPDYILRDRWLWNEQYLLEGFLSFNDSFEVLAAVNWLSHNHRDRLLEACPVLLEQPESEPRSFWLRRVR
jgi:predicted O-methyltransferase YrrM